MVKEDVTAEIGNIKEKPVPAWKFKGYGSIGKARLPSPGGRGWGEGGFFACWFFSLT